MPTVILYPKLAFRGLVVQSLVIWKASTPAVKPIISLQMVKLCSMHSSHQIKYWLPWRMFGNQKSPYRMMTRFSSPEVWLAQWTFTLTPITQPVQCSFSDTQVKYWKWGTIDRQIRMQCSFSDTQVNYWKWGTIDRKIRMQLPSLQQHSYLHFSKTTDPIPQLLQCSRLTMHLITRPWKLVTLFLLQWWRAIQRWENQIRHSKF